MRRHRGHEQLADTNRANSTTWCSSRCYRRPQDSPVDLFRAKAEAERYLRDSSASWTIVRSARFLETWLDVLTQTAGKGGSPSGYSATASNRSASSRPRAWRPWWRAQPRMPHTAAGSFEISGPPLTMNELADALQRAPGWTGPPRAHPSRRCCAAPRDLHRDQSPRRSPGRTQPCIRWTPNLAGPQGPRRAASTIRRTLADVLDEVVAT